MDYLNMNAAQVSLLEAMTGPTTDSQVVLKPRQEDTPERVQGFTQLNKDVDELVQFGLVEELSDIPPKPPGFLYDFRMVRITALGRAMFTNEKGTSVRAV